MHRSFQNNQRSKKSIKLALLTLGLLFSIIIFGKLLFFLYSLGEPFNLETFKQSSWDGSSSVNLAFLLFKNSNDQDVFFLSLNPKNKEINIMAIADQTYVELPNGLGFWPVGSIYKLGQEANPPNGANTLKHSMSKLLGLPIDGIVIQKGYDNKNLKELVLNLHSNPFAILMFMRTIQTDLTVMEAFRVINKLSQIREDKITYLDFEKSDITESKLLPDTSRVLGVNTIKLDLYIRDHLADAAFLDEDKTIAVYNATGHQGLAQQAARFITNMGGNVIIVSGADNKQENSAVILGQQDSVGLTGDRLTSIFAPHCLKTECKTEDTKILSSRAQINIVLGEDYWKLWNGP